MSNGKAIQFYISNHKRKIIMAGLALYSCTICLLTGIATLGGINIPMLQTVTSLSVSILSIWLLNIYKYE